MNNATLLVVLDGFGYTKTSEDNAIASPTTGRGAPASPTTARREDEAGDPDESVAQKLHRVGFDRSESALERRNPAVPR